MASGTVDFLDLFDVKESHDVVVQVVCTGLDASATGMETQRCAKRQRRGDAAAQTDAAAAADQQQPRRVLREIYGHHIFLKKSSEWMRARLSPDWNQVGVWCTSYDCMWLVYACFRRCCSSSRPQLRSAQHTCPTPLRPADQPWQDPAGSG